MPARVTNKSRRKSRKRSTKRKRKRSSKRNPKRSSKRKSMKRKSRKRSSKRKSRMMGAMIPTKNSLKQRGLPPCSQDSLTIKNINDCLNCLYFEDDLNKQKQCIRDYAEYRSYEPLFLKQGINRSQEKPPEDPLKARIAIQELVREKMKENRQKEEEERRLKDMDGPKRTAYFRNKKRNQKFSQNQARHGPIYMSEDFYKKVKNVPDQSLSRRRK